MTGKRLAQPVPPLAEPTPQKVVIVRKRGGDSQANLGLAGLTEPELQRRLDVRKVAVNPGELVHLPGTDPIGVSLLDESRIPVPVPATQRLCCTLLLELRPAEVPDRLQPPIAREFPRRFPDQYRLVDESPNQVKEGVRREVITATDGLRCFKFEATPEHG